MKKLVLRAANLRVSVCMLALAALSVTSALAQTGGTVSSALASADTEIRTSFAPVSKIMFAVMAIIGVVGAISVYGKWSAGDPDTRKSAAAWFGALIFAGLVLLVLKAVFGVS